MDSLFDLPSDFSDNDTDTDNYNHNENDVVLSSYHQQHHHNRRRAFSLLPCPSPASFPEFVEEEELEWISNKDAFPMVESFVDIIPNHPSISSAATTSNDNGSHLSPVSVLENSSTSCSNNSINLTRTDNGKCVDDRSLRGFFKVPGKARTNRLRKRRGEMSGELFRCWEKAKAGPRRAGIGRKYLHCGSEKTPQWRAGPLGPKTLCNACGVRYKSGRLVPEYRPASSPTFSSELHSNSHRKIVEMRKQKMTGGEACAF